MEIKTIIFPDTSSHVHLHNAEYHEMTVRFQAFPDTNILSFDEQGARLETDYYGRNTIRPQQRILVEPDFNVTITHPPVTDAKLKEWAAYSKWDGCTTAHPKMQKVDFSDHNKNWEAVMPDLAQWFTNLASFPQIIPHIEDVEDYRFVTVDNLMISFWNSKVYIVSDFEKKEIISVLLAPEYDLQEGDGDSYLYIIRDETNKTKHFMIWNDGDVYSVVLINISFSY